MAAIHDVLISKAKIEEVAKAYGKTSGYVNQLAQKYKRKPTFMRELIDKHDLA